MDIKNLKIFKVISSFLIVTIFTTFIINDYSYALTAKPISDLATIRKSAGYDKSFSYIGLQEENAINKNAKSFVNTISDTYNKQKERLEDNFETKKSEVISNKNAKNETILQEAEKNKTTLTESYKKNRSDYESTYNEKKASVTADYNSRIEQMQNTLASLKETKAIQDKTAANDAALAAESSKASNLVNQVNTGGLAAKPDSSEIGSDSTASGSNTAAKIQKLEKKLASVKSQKEKDLASLDKRADYAMSELEAKYLSDIKSLQQRTDGYVSSLENLTNTELQKLEENNQKSLNTLYENSNQEINSYLFAEKSGLYTKAYDYDSKSIMRDLKLDSDTKSGKETKIDGPTGGYIGDLEEYNSIEQQKQIYLANQYLAKAEKLLDSGSSDGVARAAEYTAAAGVVNKDAEVLMPMKYNGTNGINEPIDMSLRDGKANGSTVDSSIITLNKAEEAAKERLLSDADEMIAESDKMIEDIKKGQENSTQTATDEMAGTTNQAVEDMNSMTMQEMQELLNFVYELEGYLDMVWPKDAGAEYARKQEAIQEAEKLIEEEQANVKWAIAGLVISAVMIIVSLVVIIVKWVAGTGLVIAGLAFCAALLPCVGIPMIAGGSILIALAVVAAVVALAGLITSIVFLVTAQNRLSKAIAVRDKLQQELSSLETAMLGGATKSATETDAEWAARKMGQNTSYSRYLAAQADYNKAMENFKAMFYDEFGLFAEKKVRKMIDKIKKLMGSRNLSDLSKEELVKLQELLFYFKHASKNKKLLSSMSDLKIKYAAYQQRLKELKEDQTLIKYTDRDGKEIEITMAAAYEHMNYLNAMLSYLGEVIKYEYEHADAKTKTWIALNNMYTWLGGGYFVGDYGNGQYTKQYAGAFTIAIQAVTGFFSYIFGNVVGIFTGETLGWSDYWGEADEAGNLRGKNAKNFEGAAAWGAKVGSVFGKYVASMTIGLFKAIVVDNFLQAKNTMTMYAENFRKYGFWKGLGESAKGILYMPFNLLGSLIGFKQGWLQAVIDGKSFKEAAGLNSFDDWITNWNPGEVAGMVINLAGTAGAGATGALKAAFSWTVAVAKGIVSVIKGIGTMVVNAVNAMFKWVASGGIFTWILKGIVATVATIGLVAVAAVAITAIVVAAPVILTAVVVADVVKTVIKESWKAITNIVNTIKNIGTVAGTFGKTVSAIFKAAWNFVKDTAVKIVGKIKELWAGGFWSKVGAVLTAIALPFAVGLAAVAAVTTAVVATVALGVVTVIGGDNSAELLKNASDAIIDAVKGGGSALKAFGTLLKSTGKLLLNALTDMDADAFSAATGGQKALQIMQGISSFIQNVGAIAMLTTGGIGGLFLGVGLKIVGKWYNENILGQKYSRKYEASKAVEDLFGADNLKGSTNLNVSEDQVSTLKQLIDAQGYVVVDIDGVATRLNSTEFDVYVAKGGDVARVQIEVNGELKTFTFSSGEGTNSASQLKNLILQGMSSASLRLLQDEISKNNKNSSAKETFAMISKELLQRTDIGKVLNLSTELSKEGNKTPLDLDDEGVAFIENKRKQIQELLDLEASTKSSDWEKSKQKKELTKLMEEVDQLQVKIGGQDYTLRELRNLTGVDISVEIIKNGKDLGDIKSIIKNVLSSPTVIQNIQETVVIRTKSYTDMVEVNKTVQEAKKKLKEEMETDLESKAKELEDTKKQIVENDANIQKKQDELKKLMNDLDGNLDEDVKTQIKNLEDEIKSSQTRRDDLDNDMQVLKSDIDDLQKTISDVSMRMSESKSVSKKIQSEIDSDVEQKTKLEDELQKIKDDNDEVIARKSRLEQEDQDLDNQKKVLDEDNDAIVKQIDDLKRKEAEQKKVLEDAENDFNQKKEEVEELNKQIQQKEKETDLEVARKKQQIADNAEEIENLKKEIEEQKQKQKLEMDEEIAAKTKDINAKYNKEKKQLQEIKKLILKYKNGDDRVKNDLIVAFRRGSDLARNLELTDGFYAEVMKKDGLKNLLTRIESLDSDLNYAKSQALSEIDIPISNEIKNLQSKISALENQNTRLSRSIDSSDSGLSSLKSKLQAETANLGKMQSKLESIKSSQPVDFDGQIQILTKKIESNNSQIADISIRKVSLKSEISSLKIRDTADLSSKITDLSRKIEINQTSLDENNALIKKYGEDLDQINEKYEMKKDEYTRKDKEKENLDQKLQDDTDSIEKIKNESSQSKIDKLNKEIEELQGQKKLFDTKAELEKNIGELQTKYKSLDSGTVEDLYKNLKEKYGVEGKTAKDYPELKYGEFDQIKKTLETLETTLSGGKLDGLGKTGVKLVESMGGETAESFYKSQYGQILNRYNDAGLFSEERKQLKELMKKYDQTGTKLEFKREAQEALKMKENLDTEQVKKLNIEKELAVIESMQKDLDSDTLSTKELKSKIKAIKEANNDINTAILKDMESIRHQQDKILKTQMDSTMEDVGDFIKKGKNKEKFLQDIEEQITKSLDNEGKNKIEAVKAKKELANQELENLKQDPKLNAKKILSLEKHIQNLEEAETNIFKSHISEDFQKLKQTISSLDDSTPVSERSKIMEEYRKLMAKSLDGDIAVREQENSLAVQKLADKMSELQATKIQAQNKLDALEKQRADILRKGENSSDIDKLIEKEKMGIKIGFAEINKQIESFNKQITDLKISQQKSIISAPQLDIRRAIYNNISFENFTAENISNYNKLSKLTKENIVSGVKSGELAIASYKYQYGGKEVALTNKGISGFIKENISSDTYLFKGLIARGNKERLLEEYEGKEKRDTEGKKAKNITIEELKSGKEMKKILEGEEVGIIDKIIKEGKFSDKEKAIKVLEAEIEALKEDPDGKTFKFFNKTTTKNKIEALENIVKSLKDGKEGEGVKAYLQESGDYGLRVLKAGGFDADYKLESQLHMAKVRKETFNRLGTVISESEIVKADPSRSLKSNVEILLIEQGLYNEKRKDTLSEIDVRNEEGGKALKEVAEEIMTKEIDADLGKGNVIEKLKGKMTEVDSAKYSEISKKVSGSWTEEEVSFVRNTEKELLKNASASDLRDLSQTLRADDPLQSVLNKTIVAKDLEYQAKSIEAPFKIQRLNSQANDFIGMTDLTARSKIRDIISKAKDQNDPEVQIAKKVELMLDGKLDLGEVFDEMQTIMKQGKNSDIEKMFVSKGMQAVNREINGLVGDKIDSIKDTISGQFKTRGDIKGLNDDFKKYISTEVENAKKEYFSMLDRETARPMEKMFALMKESIKNTSGDVKIKVRNEYGVETGAEVKISEADAVSLDQYVRKTNYEILEKQLGDDLTFDKIIKEVFDGQVKIDSKGRANFTKMQSDVYRAMILKIEEGHYTHKEGNRIVSSRETLFSDTSNMSQSQNQLLMMNANDAGEVAALGMGGGKTRVYPLVIASQMLSGKSGMAEILVSAKQEVSNMLGVDASGNTSAMKRFFGVDMQNGTEGNDVLAGQLKNANDKTIFVFDIETRGHLSHEVRHNSDLKSLMKIGTIAIDEADALALRQQSFINAERSAASYDIKYQAVKILETYDEVLKTLREKDPDIDSKAFVQDGSGTNTMDPAVLKEMLKKIGKDDIMEKGLYKSGLVLDRKNRDGQYQYMIEQVLRARKEVMGGETTGGYKTDSVSGIQYGVQDGVDLNSVATQVLEAYNKNGGKVGDFSRDSFESVTKTRLGEFKAEVSKTTVEASSQEILTRDAGIEINVFGGSGTTWGAKRISNALAAPVVELAEGTFAEYGYKTKVLGDKKSSTIAAEFANGEVGESNWGKLLIQDHRSIKDNLIETLKGKVKDTDPSISDFIETVSKITGKTDRVSTAELASDLGADGKIIDKVFNKEGGGYRSLGELIRTGEVEYKVVEVDGVQQKQFVARDGHVVQVSAMDILKSRSVIDTMLGEGKGQGVVDALGTKKIYVIDNYTKAENVTPLAKQVSANEWTVYATNKAGRGMDFRGKMKLLVLDSENIPKNDLLQILGRAGRGASRDTFSREVVVNTNALKTRFEEAREVINAEKAQMEKSKFFKEAQEAFNGGKANKQQQQIMTDYNNLNKKLSNYDTYIEEINSGGVPKSSVEMVQDSSVIVGQQKANGSSLYQIGEGVRSALLKIPLEQMMTRANPKDRIKLQKAVDELVRKARGQEAELLRQMDAEFKDPKEIFKKIMESNLKAAEDVFKVLSSDTFSSKATRKEYFGDSEGIVSKDLKAELKARRNDLHNAQKLLNKMMDNDWQELRFETKSKAESSGIYTMSQINSSDSPFIASQVLDTAAYIARDLTPQRKNVSPEQAIKSVKIVNSAMTGNSNTGAIMFKTNDANIIATQIEDMMVSGSKKISQIHLTPQQFTAIQNTPIARQILETANNSRSFNQSSWWNSNRGKVKIYVSKNEEQIKQGNVISYNEAVARTNQNISLTNQAVKTKMQAQAIQMQMNQLIRDQQATVVTLGVSSEDRNLDERAKKLFERQIKSEKFGISEEIWSKKVSDDAQTSTPVPIIVKVDADRWDGMSVKEQEDFKTKFRAEAQLRKEQGQGEMHLFVSSSRLQDVKEKKAIAEQLASAKTEEQKEQAYIAIEDSYRLELKSKEQEEKEKIRQAIILKQKAEAEIKKLEMESRSKESEIMDQKIDVWNSKENKQKEEERKRLIIERQKLQKQQEKLKDEEEILKQKKSLLVRDQYRLEQVRQDLKQENQNITKERQSVRNLKQEEEQLRQEEEQLRQKEDLLMQKKQELENEKKSIEREEASVGSFFRKAENESEINDNQRNLTERKSQILQKQEQLVQKQTQLGEKQEQLVQKQTKMGENQKLIVENQGKIKQKKTEIAENVVAIEVKGTEVKEKQAVIESKGKEIDKNKVKIKMSRFSSTLASIEDQDIARTTLQTNTKRAIEEQEQRIKDAEAEIERSRTEIQKAQTEFTKKKVSLQVEGLKYNIMVSVKNLEEEGSFERKERMSILETATKRLTGIIEAKIKPLQEESAGIRSKIEREQKELVALKASKIRREKYQKELLEKELAKKGSEKEALEQEEELSDIGALFQRAEIDKIDKETYDIKQQQKAVARVITELDKKIAEKEESIKKETAKLLKIDVILGEDEKELQILEAERKKLIKNKTEAIADKEQLKKVLLDMAKKEIEIEDALKNLDKKETKKREELEDEKKRLIKKEIEIEAQEVVKAIKEELVAKKEKEIRKDLEFKSKKEIAKKEKELRIQAEKEIENKVKELKAQGKKDIAKEEKELRIQSEKEIENKVKELEAQAKKEIEEKVKEQIKLIREKLKQSSISDSEINRQIGIESDRYIKSLENKVQIIDERISKFGKLKEEKSIEIKEETKEKRPEVQQVQLQQRYIENSRKLFGADISEYIKMGTLEEVEEEIQKLQTEEERLEQETENMEKEESIVDYGVGVLQGEIDTDEEDLVKENELKEKEFSFLEIQQKLVKIEEVKQKKQILDERLEILRSMDPKILKEYVVENAYNQEASLEKEFGTLTEGVYSVEATDYGVLLASTSDEMVDKWTKAETERRKEIFNAENKGIKGQIKEGYWESVSSDMSGFTGWIHSFPSWSKDVWGRTGSWNTFRGAIVKIGIFLSWIGYILAYPLMWIAKGLFSITANFVEKLFGSDVLEYKEDEATTVGKGFHSMTWWQKTLFILGNIVTLGGVSVSYTIIKKSGYEGKTGFGKFGMIILGILTSIPFISHIIALPIAAKMKDNSLLLETKSIQLDFSNSIFRQAKRDLKEGKITQTEYKDLIAMETEQMLMDRYIRNSLTDEVLEIKVSAEKSEINNEAIRQGIKKFNEKKRMLISTEVPKNMPKAIVIKDTKGNIVDIYSRERQEQKYKENGEEDGVILIDTGELQSRNEDLQKVLSGGQADMSQFAGMFGGMDLSSFGKPKTIKPKKIRTNAKREQQEEIMKELRQTKSGAVIIDLDNVAEENIDDITSFILREVSESKEITKNVVFMKNGKYFGATDQKVSEKIKEWDTKLKGLGIKTPSIKFNYKNIDLESAQMKPNFDEKYISEQVSLGELENLGNLVYGDTNTRAYLDTKFRDENGEEKELFTLEVSDSKVKVKINEKSIDVLSIDSNRVKLMQRLRQIEMQYRDLQKGIEIELPEIKEGTSLDDLDKEAERQKALAATKIARGKVKNTCEFFVAEMAGIKEQSNRKFVLMNDRGNILRVNNPGLFGILGTDLQGQKVLVAPDYVLTNEVLFKEWLSRMLRSEEMTEMQGDIIVGLEKAEILPIAIQEVLTKSFNNERMKFINRKGEIVRSFIEEEKAKTILDKNEILILNPRLNSRIETSMKTVNWETVKVVKISDELAKSPKQINDLMTLLTRYGYQGDIEVLANNGSSVKLWQEKMFGEGVLVRDVSDTKEFDEILESLEKYNEKLGKTEISQYASTPIVLNINAREKLERVHTHWALSIFTLGILPIVRYFRADNKLRRINKLIEEGVFGNITIMQRGEIVATNDSQILARDKQFEQLRENQIFELRARNKDIKDDLSKSKDLLFTTIDKEQKEKDAEKQKVRVFEKGITSPVYRGNVVMNMKGADDFIKQQTALLTKTTEQLTEKDIVELSTQSANAVRTYGIDFAMESRVKMKSDKSNTLTNARYLDTAA